MQTSITKTHLKMLAYVAYNKRKLFYSERYVTSVPCPIRVKKYKYTTWYRLSRF